MVEQISRNMIMSDIHIPFQDKKALNTALDFMDDYKPTRIILNGDIIDMYSLSKFDKSPERKESVSYEVYEVREFLTELRARAGEDTEIVYMHGNHENRLQRFVWANPQLADLDSLKLSNMLEFQDNNIMEVKVDGDYWASATGCYNIGDMMVMHGDSRLNGASTSKYSGYSIKNTILGSTQQSTTVGHVHRLALIKHTTKNGVMTGIEAGCLCKVPGNANWQQGFATFEGYDDGKTRGHTIYEINKGKLFVGDYIYG